MVIVKAARTKLMMHAKNILIESKAAQGHSEIM